MKIHLKISTFKKSTNLKTYIQVDVVKINFHGACNKIHSEKEIISGYHNAKIFFFEREAWHLDASKWYRNEAELYLKKSSNHQLLAQKAQAFAIDYWALAFDASLAKIRLSKERMKNA